MACFLRRCEENPQRDRYGKRLLASLGVVVAILVVFSSCLRDLSGLSVGPSGRILVVNNRPGVFALCSPRPSQLNCDRLTFRTPDYERYDFEGVTWLDETRFFAVIEKRDNECLSGCELNQEVLSFHIAPDGYVETGPCDPIRVPLQTGDNPDCEFANCGLEGIAFDPGRNVLYVAKEREQPRLFVIPLNALHCPGTEITELAPPMPLPSINDLAYSLNRDSLFILSVHKQFFYEWDLKGNRIRLTSDDWPEAKAWLSNHEGAEGIYVDDRKGRLLMLTEPGDFIDLPLPPLPAVTK